MTANLEKFQSPGKGNGLRATRDLDVGEMVADAEPFVYTVCQAKKRGATCHHCLHRYPNTLTLLTFILKGTNQSKGIVIGVPAHRLLPN